MGFNLKISGQNEQIELRKENILSVKYTSDSPDDSNARATDLGIILEIEGKILSAVNGEQEDDTRKVALWSLVPAESADAYRQAELDIVSGGQVVRKVSLPNAFVVDYTESYGDKEGTGTFSLKIKQKKEKVISVAIEGGYESTETA